MPGIISIQHPQEPPLIWDLVGGPLFTQRLTDGPSNPPQVMHLLLQLGDAGQQVLPDELSQFIGSGFLPLHFKTYR
ncbi:MAG: hypothetical protein CMA70_03385 [Euryarchaeota archaeon]|nr:hypothetical protein [Euryarchaeota archaeon]